MVDRVPKEVRSRIMASIRGKDTKPERLLRSILHKAGYRYSLKYRFPEIRCRPDVTMVSRRIAVFVDGCFWHGCPRCHPEPPRQAFWRAKIKANKERDRRQTAWLRKNGWKVVRVWEHKIQKHHLGKIRTEWIKTNSKRF